MRWDNKGAMCTTSPVPPFQCYPRDGGVDVIPYVLPIRVLDEHRQMTVEEFFGLDDEPQTRSGAS